MTEAGLIERAKAFVAAVAAAEPREIIEAFYAQDVVQEEFPNLLRPNGAVRDFINLRSNTCCVSHSTLTQVSRNLLAASLFKARYHR